MNLPDSALVPVLVAMLAAAVSLMGLVISKEVKVSEFRQAWIDKLRDDLAALVSHAYAAQVVFRLAANENDPSKKWDMIEPVYRPLIEVAARIKLRLNPDESESILTPIKRLESTLGAGMNALDYGAVSEIDQEIITESQKVLKGAWLVVRNGERFYRGARACSIVLLAICLSLSLYMVYRSEPGLATVHAHAGMRP